MRHFITSMLLLSTAGCATGGATFGATQIAEFRHPVTGEIALCRNETTNSAVIGALIGCPVCAMGGGIAYSECKSKLEQAGYVRVPVDAEIQAEIDRYDAARADSIRK